MSHVTIGDGSGPDKISYHIMIYDGVHAWDTGLAKNPPYSSGQKGFIALLREETLRNPKRWNNLTYKDKHSNLSSVIDTIPYNSKGNQSFRTLLSAKIGTNRWMLPYDGYFNRLPSDPQTILRGFASISDYPDRNHGHKSYKIIHMDQVPKSCVISGSLPWPTVSKK